MISKQYIGISDLITIYVYMLRPCLLDIYMYMWCSIVWLDIYFDMLL